MHPILILLCWIFCYWPVGPCWNSQTRRRIIVQNWWSRDESVGKAQCQGKEQNAYKVSLINSLWRFSPALWQWTWSGDSKSDKDCTDDTSGFNKVMPRKAGRQKLLTRRMRDLLQFKWRYVCIQTTPVYAGNGILDFGPNFTTLSKIFCCFYVKYSKSEWYGCFIIP